MHIYVYITVMIIFYYNRKEVIACLRTLALYLAIYTAI